MGKNKGGGATYSTPKISVPPDINILNQNAFQPVGTFGAESVLGLANMGNWAANLATGGNAGGISASFPQTGLLPGGQTFTYAPFTTTGATGGGGGAGGTGAPNFLSGLSSSQLGPFLSSAVQNLLNAQSGANTIGAQAGMELNKGNQMLKTATSGTGLYKSQQAMINEAVGTEQTQVGQQLAAEGLGSSTLLKSLQGQAAVSGAAAGGQLVQGNIQLAESEQQLGQQAEQAMFNQFSTIASQSAALQQSTWTEAMQGYGAVGSFMSSILSAFGYSLQTQQDILQASEAQAQLQAQTNQTNEQASQAQSQGFSSMLGGLGSLLGGGGGSGGGLGGIISGGLGSLGGLFGGGGAAAAGAGSAGALAGGSDAILGAAGLIAAF